MNTKILEVDFLEYRPEDGGVLDCWIYLYASEWMFVTGYAAWYHWNGTHWAKDECQFLQKQIQHLMDTMNREAKSALYEETLKSDDDRDESLVNHLKALCAATRRSNGRIISIEGMAQAHRAVPAGTLDSGNVLNLKNGTLCLDTMHLREHNRDDHMTYCLDYGYDPAATAPRFEQFIQEILVKETRDENGGWVTDIELCELIQGAMGYSLTNSTKHEVMFWLSGTGGNGKSVLINVIKRLLGENAFSMNFASLGTTDGNYRLAKLVGKRVVFCTESPKNSSLAEDMMKQIADGSYIDARPIRGEPINFRSQAKIWWALNDRPIIKDTGNAIWRRLQLVPFNRSFKKEKQDTDLACKLESEISGILNFALNGLRQLNEWGRFPDSSAVAEAVKEYKHESNPVAQWLDECASTKGGPETEGSQAYFDYERWCERNGRQPLNNVNFGKELRKLDVTCIRTKHGMKYGLKVIPILEREKV